MTDKIKNLFKNKKFIIIASSAAICLVAILLIAVIAVNVGKNSRWGEGISENVPEFNAKAESITVDEEKGYAAAYYKNVTSEQVAEYISTIERECGVSFNSDKYPRSAIYGEKIIVIHYNVTEMNFSVTVTAKTYDISNTSGEAK